MLSFNKSIKESEDNIPYSQKRHKKKKMQMTEFLLWKNAKEPSFSVREAVKKMFFRNTS